MLSLRASGRYHCRKGRTLAFCHRGVPVSGFLLGVRCHGQWPGQSQRRQERNPLLGLQGLASSPSGGGVSSGTRPNESVGANAKLFDWYCLVFDPCEWHSRSGAGSHMGGVATTLCCQVSIVRVELLCCVGFSDLVCCIFTTQIPRICRKENCRQGAWGFYHSLLLHCEHNVDGISGTSRPMDCGI